MDESSAWTKAAWTKLGRKQRLDESMNEAALGQKVASHTVASCRAVLQAVQCRVASCLDEPRSVASCLDEKLLAVPWQI
eukprot:1119594-Rhodomonas_salina.1